ncbi:putative ABC transporter ATP-binding protein [Schaedlerella arabinosiphila]|nr:putative ABC transporter ATP-binding protein [Schaedlerella arabinosiphila]
MEKIRVENVSYSYQNQYQKIQAVKEVTCSFEAGNMYAITGESGSGKSTFLSLLAGLDCPESGTILVDGDNLLEIDRDAYRRKQVSMIYQAFHLFPLLNALENVMYPLELQGLSRREARQQAAECLEEVGLGEKILKQYPKMMSGGEQQRVAIARAMAAQGKILLADEPTGSVKLVQHYPKEIPVILFSLSMRISEIADRHSVRFSSRVSDS